MLNVDKFNHMFTTCQLTKVNNLSLPAISVAVTQIVTQLKVLINGAFVSVDWFWIATIFCGTRIITSCCVVGLTFLSRVWSSGQFRTFAAFSSSTPSGYSSSTSLVRCLMTLSASCHSYLSASCSCCRKFACIGPVSWMSLNACFISSSYSSSCLLSLHLFSSCSETFRSCSIISCWNW